MPNTYTQLYIQFVFAVKGRRSLIGKSWKDEMYKYITGVVQNNKSKMIAINGVEDHIHIFIGYKPSVSIPDLIKDIKVASSLWVNDKKFITEKFNWQEGYMVHFLMDSHKSIPFVNTLLTRKSTIKKTFKEEYIGFLNQFDIEYDEKYLLEFIE